MERPARRRAGFTLVEVLMAVAMLALGTLLIQEGFLRSAHLYGRYTNTMRASVWMNERLWRAREAVLFSEEPPSPDGGEFTAEGTSFKWLLGVEPLPKARRLYALKLTVDWREGSRPLSLVREIYAEQIPQPS